MKIDQIAAVVSEQTFRLIGTRMTLGSITVADLASWKTLGTVEINPSMCGPVGSMFKAISCTVMAGYSELKGVHLRLSYAYSHLSGGSNGTDAEFTFPLSI